MKIVRGMAKTFHSILENTHSPIYLHVLLDSNSKLRTSRTLRKVARNFRRRLNITYYDVNDMADQNRGAINTIRKYFFNKDVGRYKDDIFFLSEVFHDAFPKRLRKIIFLDVDLKFLSDIRILYQKFEEFQPENVIGIGPDLQPQYRVDFGQYRKSHPGTPVASARPGKQGFNTGVVLFNLDRMRRSQLYNSLLNATVIENLCNKYLFKGYLGHQDFYTLAGMEYPELYYNLDCSWNRQLDVGWRNEVENEIFDQYHRCEGKIHVMHANGDSLLPKDSVRLRKKQTIMERTFH
ncbi:xyloside xylosyltransferase 1 [Trichonephila clavata]|uniref:Xyloside xylosyltransferase 1 n=1 Tax=Trichonephila clavata TaxID=2740835 RepID=A0A8X6G894_TRICU|nr:xyloside xylosyltransferase 1 [Trichonephila clavata]